MSKYLIAILALLSAVAISAPSKLTQPSYHTFVAQHPVVLLHVYRGDCPHCETLHEELQNLKALLAGKHYQIAEINCAQADEVCSKFSMQRIPGLIVVARGTPVEYNGELTANALHEWVLEMLAPPTSPIDASTVAQKKKESNFLLVGGLNDADRILLSAATRLRFMGVPIYQTQSNKTFVNLYLKKDDRQVEYQTPILPFHLSYEVFHRARPAIMPLNELQYSFYFSTQKDSDNVIVLYDHSDGEATQMKNILDGFCQFYVAQIPCFTVSKDMSDYAKFAERFGVNSTDNSVIIFLTNRYKTVFRFNSTVIAYTALDQFVKAAKQGKVAASKTQAAQPTEVSYNFVMNLDSRTYYPIVQSQPFVFVEYFSNSCPHCISFAQEYQSVAEHFKSVSGVVVAAISADKEEKIVEAAGIEKFPTFKLFVRGQVIDYSGNRKAEAMIEFITEFSKSKLLVVPHTKDIKGSAVVISGIDGKSSLNSLPALFRRYPIYYASEEEGLKVQLIDQGTKTYEGKLTLLGVADWLEEQTAPILLSLGESPASRKLEKAMSKKKSILGFINKGQEGSVEAQLKVLEDYCSGITEFVCGYLQKGQHDYDSLTSWIGDPDVSKNRVVWIDIKSRKVYLYEGQLQGLTVEQISAFVRDVKAGKIKNHKKDKVQDKPEATRANRTEAQNHNDEL